MNNERVEIFHTKEFNREITKESETHDFEIKSVPNNQLIHSYLVEKFRDSEITHTYVRHLSGGFNLRITGGEYLK